MISLYLGILDQDLGLLQKACAQALKISLVLHPGFSTESPMSQESPPSQANWDNWSTSLDQKEDGEAGRAVSVSEREKQRTQRSEEEEASEMTPRFLGMGTG